MVAALDDFIGNTTDVLKRTGLWSETLLILHADNGAVQAGGPHSHNVNGVGGFQGTGGTAYPYRGAKFNVRNDPRPAYMYHTTYDHAQSRAVCLVSRTITRSLSGFTTSFRLLRAGMGRWDAYTSDLGWRLLTHELSWQGEPRVHARFGLDGDPRRRRRRPCQCPRARQRLRTEAAGQPRPVHVAVLRRGELRRRSHKVAA